MKFEEFKKKYESINANHSADIYNNSYAKNKDYEFESINNIFASKDNDNNYLNDKKITKEEFKKNIYKKSPENIEKLTRSTFKSKMLGRLTDDTMISRKNSATASNDFYAKMYENDFKEYSNLFSEDKYVSPNKINKLISEVEYTLSNYDNASNLSSFMLDNDKKTFLDAMSNSKLSLNQINDDLKKRRDYMAQFENENKYKEYITEKSELDRLNKLSIAELDKLIKDKKKEPTSATQSIFGSDVFENDDTEKNTQKYTEIKNSKIKSEIESNAKKNDDYIDSIKAAKKDYEADNFKWLMPGKSGNILNSIIYHDTENSAPNDYMTETEKNTFLYLYNANGSDSAMDYYSLLEERLNAQDGENVAKKIDNSALKYLYAPLAGIEQFGSGLLGSLDSVYNVIAKLTSLDYINPRATTPTQYTSSYIRDSLGNGTSKVAYDLLQNIGNNAPSMILSAGTNNSTLGAAMIGTSAGGNKYNEMRKKGYSNSESFAAGTLVALSETCFEKLLTSVGGATKQPILETNAGKGLTSRLERSATSIAANHPLIAKMVYSASNVLADSVGEAIEEGLQDVLEPYIDAIATGKSISNVDVDLDKALYSALIGGISGGLFAANGSIINELTGKTDFENVGKIANSNKKAEEIINLAKTMPKETKAYKAVSKISDPTKVSNKELGKLVKFINLAESNNIANNNDDDTKKAEALVKNSKRNDEWLDASNYEIDIFAKEHNYNAAATESLKSTYVRSNSNAEDYVRSYDTFYRAGAKGIQEYQINTIDAYKDVYGITATQKKAAFESGRKNYTYKKGVNYDLISNVELTDESKTVLKGIETFFDFYDIDAPIVITDRIYSGKAEKMTLGKFNGNTVFINSEDLSAGEYSSVAGHEALHWLKKDNPTLANDLILFINNKLFNVDGFDYENRVMNLKKMYGKNFSTEYIQEEMAANTMFTLFDDVGTLEKIANENQSLLKKIKEFISDFIEALKKAVNGLTRQTAEYKALQNNIKTMESIRDKANEIFDKNKLERATRNTSKENDTSKKENEIFSNDSNQRDMLPEDVPNTALQRIKDAFIEIDSDDKDYSFEEIYDSNEINTLKNRNEELHNTVTKQSKIIKTLEAAGKELIKNYQMADKKRISEKDLRTIINRIVKKYSAKDATEKEFSEVRKIFNIIANSANITYNEVNEMLASFSDEIIKNASFKDSTMRDEHKEIRTHMQGVHLYVNDTIVSELQYMGGYSYYKKELFGNHIYLTRDKNDVSVDGFYKELEEKFPGYFDDNANSADLIMRIISETEKWKYGEINPYINDIENATANIVSDLYNAYFLIPEVKTNQKLLADLKNASIEIERLRKERKNAYNNAKERIYNRQAESKLRENTYREALSLYKKLSKNAVPQSLQSIVKTFLQSIDYNRKNSKSEETQKTKTWKAALRDIKNYIDRSNEYSNVGEYATFEEEYNKKLEKFITVNDEVKDLTTLTFDQQKELNYIIKILNSAVINLNKAFSDIKTEKINEFSKKTCEEMQTRYAHQTAGKFPNKVLNMINLEMSNAFTFFNKLGPTSECLCNALYSGFEKRTKLFNEIEVKISKIKAATKVNVKGLEKECTCKISSGTTMSFTTGQAMDIYLSLKRNQALGHIKGQGFIFKNTESNFEKLHTDTSGDLKKLNDSDLQSIVKTLSSDEKKFADELQKYLATDIQDWLNETSIKLYNNKRFNDPNYWQIVSDERFINKSENEKNKSPRYDAILHKGWTKSIVKEASNSIVIENAFEKFARLAMQSAVYNAMGPAVRDMENWYNYKDGDISTKQSIINLLGIRGEKYISKFMEDINGTKEIHNEYGFSDKLIKNFKIAKVGFNVRSAIQQPFSIFRAQAVLNPKYIIKGLEKKANFELTQTYSATALWKSKGFFETDVGESMIDILSGESSTLNKVRQKSMYLSQKGDDYTLAKLFNACCAELDDNQPDLKKGSESYYKAAGKRLTEVINKTQVVDTIFHRADIMRSKNQFAKIGTAFMSEPIMSYNIVMRDISAIYQAKDKTAKNKAEKNLVRSLYSCISSIIATKAAASFIDVMRHNIYNEEDEEKYKNYFEYFSSGVIDDLRIGHYIPFLKEILSVTYKFLDIRMEYEGIKKLDSTFKNAINYFNGTGKKTWTQILYDMADGLSTTFGIPIYNAIRDLKALSETIFGMFN